MSRPWWPVPLPEHLAELLSCLVSSGLGETQGSLPQHPVWTGPPLLTLGRHTTCLLYSTCNVSVIEITLLCCLSMPSRKSGPRGQDLVRCTPCWIARATCNAWHTVGPAVTSPVNAVRAHIREHFLSLNNPPAWLGWKWIHSVYFIEVSSFSIYILPNA